MKLKLYFIITILLPVIALSQRRQNDTLACNGILEDRVLSKILAAYRSKPEKPKKVFVDRRITICGNEAMQEIEERRCNDAHMILKKYPFLIDEIKNLAHDYPGYLNMDLFWMEKEKDENDESLQIYRDTEFEKWKSKGNHSYYSMAIISDKKNDHHENILLTILFPKKIITKKYQLSLKDEWTFKKL
ncbi:hypothetical protein [Chryseobacterium sp. MEBOG07]|uniref:hypothetical protein n=1 Tax=Chryseobacterium sp. MEBOG07 TaxID=2879939 RepID=UPI001F44AAF1|nr:hypothetical protein [Chryseobacterium sp. MEBOG07]UKB77652.1 hypothetical protein LF886_14260 [Chryseobacterium sp. MEBOG07]